jgi:hypothetical protein
LNHREHRDYGATIQKPDLFLKAMPTGTILVGKKKLIKASLLRKQEPRIIFKGILDSGFCRNDGFDDL